MIDSYLKKLSEKSTTFMLIKHDLEEAKKKKKKELKRLKTLEGSRELIQLATQITQEQLSIKVAGVVTKALEAVFENPYEFQIDFVKRRNVTECDLLFIRGDKKRKPLDSCGYGTADIASLALRMAYLKMDKEVLPLLVLDEPTRNLDKYKQPLASIMIKELSKTGFQFIIVTHNKDLTEAADKVFQIENDNGISRIKTL